MDDRAHHTVLLHGFRRYPIDFLRRRLHAFLPDADRTVTAIWHQDHDLGGATSSYAIFVNIRVLL
jgi:hypothetical protein